LYSAAVFLSSQQDWLMLSDALDLMVYTK
jgi:hypothetical protein